MSEHKNVYAAIAAVQAKLDPILADDEADTGKYAYKYATLPQVWRHIRPLLAEAGIAVVYETISSDSVGVAAVTLRVKHAATDTEHTVSLPLVGYQATMQGLGGALTYARRYLLHLAFGLAIEGEDKEAGHGAAPPKQAKRQAPPLRPQEKAATSAHDGEKLTAGQLQLLDGNMNRRAREIGEGITAEDIAREIRKRNGWKTLADCPTGSLNRLMAEIRSWEPPSGADPEQGKLV